MDYLIFIYAILKLYSSLPLSFIIIAMDGDFKDLIIIIIALLIVGVVMVVESKSLSIRNPWRELRRDRS